MKAQFSIEYFIALVLFIGFITYIFFQVVKFTPAYLNELRNEEIRSETYQVSEMLVNDAGEPLNWEVVADSSIKRVGLLDNSVNKTNYLSLAKISAFQTKCQSNYANIKKWIGTDHEFSIIFSDKSNGDILINCRPPTITTRAINMTIRRLVAFDSNYGELIVQVW